MEDKFTIGEAPDPVSEVRNLLLYNDFLYEEEEGRFILWFMDRGMKWKTEISVLGQCVLIYGIYPFAVFEGEEREAFLREVNEQAVFGAMIAADDRLLFRTAADLFDAYSAYEQIGRSLEYNAGIITAFWEKAEKIKKQ